MSGLGANRDMGGHGPYIRKVGQLTKKEEIKLTVCLSLLEYSSI